MLRPRIDGLSNVGIEGTISEWGDAAVQTVQLVDEDGITVAGTLRSKSVGLDLFFELEAPTASKPDVYIAIDVNGDQRPDYGIASVGGRVVSASMGSGGWIRAPDTTPSRGRVVVDRADEKDWTTEASFSVPPEAASTRPIGWTILLTDTTTRNTYWYPRPSGACSFARDPIGFPGIEGVCFAPMRYAFDFVRPKFIPIVDVGIDRLEVTQAIQTEDQAMPLVLGKRALARVFVRGGGSGEVEVTLSGWDGGLFLGSMTRTFSPPLNPSRARIQDSANFLLPPSWTNVPQLGLVAEVRHLTGFEQLITSADNTLSQTFTFGATHDLITWILPVNDSGSLPNATTTSWWSNSLASAYPIAHPMFLTLASDLLGTWRGSDEQLLVELNEILFSVLFVLLLLEILGADIEFEIPDQIFGARSCDVGGLSDPVWFDNGQSFAAWGGQSVAGEMIMAHEIEHNIGPDDAVNGRFGRHIGGCGADQGDSDWRNLFGAGDFTIQDVGWNPHVPDPETDSQAIIPSNFPDFMSYCSNVVTAGLPEGTLPTQWISTYRWERLFERFQNWVSLEPGLQAPRLGPLQSPSPTVRVIRGSTPLNGNTTLDLTYDVPGVLPLSYRPARATNASFESKIVTLDNQGVPMDTIYVDPVFVNANGKSTSEYPFVFYVSDDGAISAIELRDAADNLLQSYVRIETPQVAFTSVPSSFTRGRPATVAWSASAPNSSFLAFRLEYSTDGLVWFPLGGWMRDVRSTELTVTDLPGSVTGRLRIRATNGFDTSSATSSEFGIPDRSPSISLSGTARIQSAGSAWSYEASVVDPDDPKLNTTALSWFLDGTVIGTGPSVDFRIDSLGRHTLVARYHDSIGAIVERTIALEAIAQRFPTPQELDDFLSVLSVGPVPGEVPWSWLVGLAAVGTIVVAIVLWQWRRRKKDGGSRQGP